MTETWAAENIPAYQFDGSSRRPTTDEHAAMSAPIVVVRDVSEYTARTMLIAYAIRDRSYAERYGSGDAYTRAITDIESGANMVRVGGRAYRLRDVNACEKTASGHPHTRYQNCSNCLPDTYPVYTEK